VEQLCKVGLHCKLNHSCHSIRGIYVSEFACMRHAMCKYQMDTLMLLHAEADPSCCCVCTILLLTAASKSMAFTPPAVFEMPLGVRTISAGPAISTQRVLQALSGLSPAQVEQLEAAVKTGAAAAAGAGAGNSGSVGVIGSAAVRSTGSRRPGY
jgi:hypothetical protein